MKLTKLSNGNVLVSNTQGEVITSLVATTLVHRHPRHGQGVQLTSIANDQHTDKAFVIYNDNLTLEIEGVATKWTGTRAELIEKLSLEFFFNLAGATGGGLTTYDHYSDIPSDLKVGSQFVLLNASGVWPNRKKTGLWTKDSDGVRRLGAMSMVAANIIIQPHRWLNANDLQAGLIQIVNKIPSLTTVYNTENPEWTAALNQIAGKKIYDEIEATRQSQQQLRDDLTKENQKLKDSISGVSNKGKLVHTMTLVMSSNQSAGYNQDVNFNSVFNNVVLIENVLTPTSGGFKCKAGFVIEVTAFAKVWSGGAWIGFSIHQDGYRVGTEGGDATGVNSDSNTGGGGESRLFQKVNNSNSLYTLRITGGSSNIYAGNSNIAETQMTIKAYAV